MAAVRHYLILLQSDARLYGQALSAARAEAEAAASGLEADREGAAMAERGRTLRLDSARIEEQVRRLRVSSGCSAPHPRALSTANRRPVIVFDSCFLLSGVRNPSEEVYYICQRTP